LRKAAIPASLSSSEPVSRARMHSPVLMLNTRTPQPQFTKTCLKRVQEKCSKFVLFNN
jgi:hypothetical protein